MPPAKMSFGVKVERGQLVRVLVSTQDQPAIWQPFEEVAADVRLVITHIFFSFQLGLLLRTSTSIAASHARWFATLVRRRFFVR